MVSKNGYHLLKPEAIEELKSLISISTLVTPNIPEAEILSDMKIKTQEDVINRINKIDKHDISYVLERCFKPGIISTAFVGQGVETDKLNSILENSKVAYKNSIDKKFYCKF